MRAVWYDAFGTADKVLHDGRQPTPQPQPGEVLVRLHSSGVNPSDVKKRAGSNPQLLDDGFVIPHSDGAGVIEAVGDGVSGDRRGERVWVYQAQYERRFGTAAEFVALSATRAVRLPDHVTWATGACLGIPAMTAHRCVFADGDITGQQVLVTGGAGRVGYYAIQWAKRADARVIATASNAADESLCRTLGADIVVNHRDEGWGEKLLELTGGQKVDRVVDVQFGANLAQVLKCIKVGGTIATYSSTQVPKPQLPFIEMMFQDLTVRMIIVYAMPEAAKLAAIEDITRALEHDTLHHRIAHEVPLAETARAHRLIEEGGFGGCVIVTID